MVVMYSNPLSILYLILVLLVVSCNTKVAPLKVASNEVDEATPAVFEKKFDATLNLDGALLPFTLILGLDAKKQVYFIKVINGNEVIEVSEINHFEDSLLFKMPLFDNEFKGTFKNDRINGNWYNYAKSKDYKLPLIAKPAQTIPRRKPNIDLTGKW